MDKAENETPACKQPMHPVALIAEFRVLAPQQDVPAVSHGRQCWLLTRVHHEEHPRTVEALLQQHGPTFDRSGTDDAVADHRLQHKHPVRAPAL